MFLFLFLYGVVTIIRLRGETTHTVLQKTSKSNFSVSVSHTSAGRSNFYVYPARRVNIFTGGGTVEDTASLDDGITEMERCTHTHIRKKNCFYVTGEKKKIYISVRDTVCV